MKSRSRHRAKRQPLSWKAKLIAGAVGLLLVWQTSVISLAAGHADYSDDIKAADYATVSPAAATAAAGQRLTDGDPAGAKVFATHALSAAPIASDSLRDLGLAEQGLGNWQSAGAIFSQGAALGWHDVPTQLWLAQAFLQQKDYDAAAQRADAALRVVPTSTDLYRTLDQLIVDPAFARALAGRLALSPDWRGAYLISVNDLTDPALIARARLMALMAGSATPPSREELVPLLSALVRADKARLARVLWLRNQPASPSGISDPIFAHIGTSGMSPFEWSMFSVPGVKLSIEPQGAGNTLSATTDGTASGTIVRQSLALPPGPHSLTFTGTMPPAAHEGFGWSITCRNRKTVLNTVRVPSPPPYRFDVPRDCTSQKVELLAAGSAAAAGSEVSFKRIDIH